MKVHLLKKNYYDRLKLSRFFSEETLEHCEIKVFHRGEKICEAEMPIHWLFFFVEGSAKVYFAMENGRQLLLTFHEPLQLFGDLELLEEKNLSTNTVEAITTCTCLAFRREYALSVLAKDPLFLKELSLSLGRKLGRVIKNSALNQLSPLENRVASYILATEEDNVFSGNMSQIADQLGTSFRHLHRTLQKFCEQDILRKHKTKYELINRAVLKEKATGVFVIK